jgi:hypothetical protein
VGPLDIQLSADELERLGVDAATAVRLPPENGGGFFVNLEFQHQLHCVVSDPSSIFQAICLLIFPKSELPPYDDVYELLRYDKHRVYGLQTNSTYTPWYVSCSGVDTVTL